MSEVIIKVDSLSKVYKLYNSPVDRLKESLHPLRKKYHHDFYALKDVSFEITKGESVGIIGKNGSGKSTLLKILTGVITPTSGSVTVNGKVSALLELGAGFNPELTGIENVYFNGMLMGYTRQEMDERLDAVLSFADIGEFVFQPVKTYSSGMFVRLAFAVAVQVDPEILIIDEALSVGDVFFQQKCFRKMKELSDNNTTMLLVTHDMKSLLKMCDVSVLLRQGTVVKYGDPIACSSLYNEDSRDNPDIKHNAISSKHCHGSLDVEIDNILINSNKCNQVVALEVSTGLRVIVTVKAINDVDTLNIGVTLFDMYDTMIFGTSLNQKGILATNVKAGSYYKAEFNIKLNISPGEYTLNVGCSGNLNGSSENVLFHRLLGLGPVKVTNDMGILPFHGIVDLESYVDFNELVAL